MWARNRACRVGTHADARCSRAQKEARIDIENYAPAQAQPQASAPAKTGWWPWAIAGALALALLGSGVLLYNATRPAPLRPLTNLKVEIAPDKQIVSAGRGNSLALSPDGKVNLYTRFVEPKPGHPAHRYRERRQSILSPAGDWIAFFADGKLKKVGVDGGAPITLCEVASNRGGSWGDDGNIITPLEGGTGLSRIP
ncbi:MAG: hypothetical protein ACKV22_07700, partial [Bryobacteraceae bacterium]